MERSVDLSVASSVDCRVDFTGHAVLGSAYLRARTAFLGSSAFSAVFLTTLISALQFCSSQFANIPLSNAE